MKIVEANLFHDNEDGDLSQDAPSGRQVLRQEAASSPAHGEVQAYRDRQAHHRLVKDHHGNRFAQLGARNLENETRRTVNTKLAADQEPELTSEWQLVGAIK